MGSTSISLDNFYTKEMCDIKFTLKTDFDDIKTAYDNHSKNLGIHVTNELLTTVNNKLDSNNYNPSEIIDDDSTATNNTWSSEKIKSYVDSKAMYISEESSKYNSDPEMHVTSYFTIYGNTMTIFAIQRAGNDGKTIALKYPLPFKELPTITKTYGTPAGIEKTTKNTLTEWAYDQNYGYSKQNEMHFMIQGII